MTKYEYYSASQKWPNTNIIWLPKNDQILSTNTNFVEVPKRKASKTSSESRKLMLNSLSPLKTEADYKCKQLPVHMTQPMWLWYMREDELQFWRTKYFWLHRVLKEEHSPTHFSEDWLIQSSEKWQIFMCPLIKSINAQQNMYSIQKKIPAVFLLRKLPEYEYE